MTTRQSKLSVVAAKADTKTIIPLNADNYDKLLKVVACGHHPLEAICKKLHPDRVDLTANKVYKLTTYTHRSQMGPGDVHLAVLDDLDDRTCIHIDGQGKKETWVVIAPQGFNIDVAVLDAEAAFLKRAKDNFARYNEPNQFKSGDVVRPKKGLIDLPEDSIFIFLRYLNDEDMKKPDIAGHLGLDDDCIIMMTNRHNTTNVSFITVGSNRLEQTTPKRRKKTS